jgi:hypothetical protein
MIGTPTAFWRKEEQMRLPEVRIEAAFTTIKSGSKPGSIARASLPVVTLSTTYPFLRSSGARGGPSARFPSTHNIRAFISSYLLFKSLGKTNWCPRIIHLIPKLRMKL